MICELTALSHLHLTFFFLVSTFFWSFSTIFVPSLHAEWRICISSLFLLYACHSFSILLSFLISLQSPCPFLKHPSFSIYHIYQENEVIVHNSPLFSSFRMIGSIATLLALPRYHLLFLLSASSLPSKFIAHH